MTEPIRDKESIIERVEKAAGDTAGVLRIEPSLERLIVEIGARISDNLGLTDSARDKVKTGGVRVSMSGRIVAVSVDIATDQAIPGLTTALVLRDRISEVITESGLDVGKIDVNILSVEG